MTSDIVRLDGCHPTPLASYLKALGVLRLLAEQADPNVRGHWDGERFHLKTAFDRDGLRRFFLEDYAPTPIIAPWNGRAGFLEGESGGDDGDGDASEDENDQQASTRKGAKLRRSYEQAAPPRFQHLRDAVHAIASLRIMTEMDKARAERKALEKRNPKPRRTSEINAEINRLNNIERVSKEQLVSTLRNEVHENLYVWLDACIRLAETSENSPLLLGGGSDGSRDYGMSFGLALQKLFQFDNGCAKEGRDGRWLCAALFGDAAPLGSRDSFGYLFPGQSGYNATTGYDLAKGKSPLNPWDLVFALEGAVLWSGGVTRRLENAADASAASFPFCVEMSRSGSGQLSPRDRNRAPGEVWCPIWSRPTGLPELRSLFREGRLTLGKRSVRNGLDAALAVAGLGRSRGINSFVRVGLYQSDAKMPHTAAPLRRHISGSAPDAASLGAELADHGWLSRLRGYVREKDAPAVLPGGIRALEDALFEFAARPGQRGSLRPEAVQRVLIAFGALARLIAMRPKLQKALSLAAPPKQPPTLSSRWAEAAYDGTPEFRIATALAWLHAQSAAVSSGSEDPAPSAGADMAGPRSILPMRCHLAPLDRERATDWDLAEGGALATWGHGGLVTNLCAVAQRRLIEASRLSLADKPLLGEIGVGSEDIAAFLDGQPGFDERVADLLTGLVWVRQPRQEERQKLRDMWQTRPGALSLAYAALKPLFTPDTALSRLKIGLPENFALPIPPALPGLLAANRVEEAMRLAMTRARSSGFPVPFAAAKPVSAPDAGRRLLAALLIPVRQAVVSDCIRRAYPTEEERSDAA